jgi:hypothetical protein
MLLTGIAYAVTNTVTYTGVGSHKGKPTTKKPVNFSYTGTLHIDTEPPGQQPDVAPTTDVYFDKGVRNNAAYFPFCNRSELDGVATIPAKCQKAKVGSGTAQAIAGTPGTAPAVIEPLDVLAFNGPKGRNLWLVVKSAQGAPVQLPYTVIPGTVRKSSGIFGFLVRFEVPENLQNQQGLDISLTDFKVTIPSKARTIKIKRKKVKASYLQLTACRGKMHNKAVVKFRDKDTGQINSVTDSRNGKC